MKRCIIITAYMEGDLKNILDVSENDFVICADGGYLLAREAGIIPDVVIGDFDSGKLSKDDIPEGIEIVELETHKDYTDGAVCTEYAKEHGYSSIMIVGGIGGRLDHTLANIQNIFNYTDSDTHIMVVDEKNLFFPVVDGEISFPNKEGWMISIFSHSDKSYGVTTKGLEYPLENAVLENDFPLGVSNVGIKDEISIGVEKGKLLIVMSKD